MKKACLIIFICAALLGTSAYFLRPHGDAFLETLLEEVISQTQSDFLAGPLDLEDLHLDRGLKLRIGRIKGAWQMIDGRAFAFEVQEMRSRDPLINFLRGKPVELTFESFRPQGSQHPGLSGKVLIHNDAQGTFEMDARFLGLYLEEIHELDPVNLTGASGRMTGDLFLKTDNKGNRSFKLNLVSEEPGGRLQARFFDLLKPYLPAAQKAALETISGLNTVRYREAELRSWLASPESVKVFLHIRVPDYNLNLNLNLELRVESHEVFLKLAELLGMARVTP